MKLLEQMPFSFACQGHLDMASSSLSRTFSGSDASLQWIALAFFLLVIYFISNIIILIWFKTDRFARTGKGLRLDLILGILLFGPLVLFIHMEKRPKGRVDLCFHCGKPKLRESKICFYCRHEDIDRTRHLKNLNAGHA